MRKYKILELRFKTNLGETDIIALDKKDLVFVEVKFVNKCNYGYKAIYSSDFSRLKANAIYYWQKKNYKKNRIRFDVIIIYGNMKIRHLKNVYL